ncbi:uncharacterized protein N7496_003049 [Penicillium cataractarum]|uniref:Uncharacterized protein n=1 Tax=Penicillium cataractarum TaxID=2100454 RepID=A0A9W9VIF8_9EURO|nr:uncharacterized protein N7496_003049 [Penicillium cataractarum]KAJ5380621.1 hypothetical protein N7496_003049 [Penicillium cataractarum]
MYIFSKTYPIAESGCEPLKEWLILTTFVERKSIPSIDRIQARSQESEKWAPEFAQSLQSAARHLGNTCTFDGTHVLSASSREWIKACTGEVFDLDRFPIEFPRWHYSASAMMTKKETPSLPELSVLEDEIKRYQSSTFALFFPIIDSSLIQHTINAAYYQKVSTESPTIAGARACIFAFHSLAIVVLGGPDHLPFHASLEYAREAHRHFPDIFSEAATLDGLQAILLLQRVHD